MDTRALGQDRMQVGAIGLGCMGMSWAYAESGRDTAESEATIRESIDLGMTLLDTADIYGDGHNETLVGRALAGRRADVVVATKGGLVVDDLATKSVHCDGSPGHLRSAVQASLSRLGVDVIDLYYLHRVDEQVPLAESWGAMSEMVSAGAVRSIGLSEVTVEQAVEAQAIHPVAAIQSEFSLWSRDPVGTSDDSDDDLVAWCQRHGITFVPFAPLGRGFLTGALNSAMTFEDSDLRARLPRFTPAARAVNQHIVDVVREVAGPHAATPAQVALAWVLAQGGHVIPIPGTRSRRHLRENAAATTLRLSAEDLRLLDAVPLPMGTRY
jgi:aryl-alcohol dehydrogenase-like predicted oxidoreductase